MFCDRYERAEQMFGNGLPMNTREIVSEPVHFAAMMVLYGQADAIVAGNMKMGGFRIPRREQISAGPRAHEAPVCHLHRHGSGICQKIRRPRHLLPGGYGRDRRSHSGEHGLLCRGNGQNGPAHAGQSVRVAMLSASTDGSVPELAADRTRAATALARSVVEKECLDNEITVEGEIQIDAALSPDSYSVRVHRTSLLQPSDVWVFPTLDAADISKKLICMMPSVCNYGLILGGLLFPIAQLPRLTDEDRMFGTALVVGNEAIKFHLLYPQGVAPLY